jgi:Flp pilus assembly protein TadB
MDNLNDIQKIWLSANVRDLPTSGEVVRTIKNYRTNQILRTVFVIFLSLVLGAVMVHVIFFYQSVLFVTRIGEALIFIAILFLISTNLVSLKRISGRKDFTNQEFIHYLKQQQQRQIQFHKKTQAIGFVLSSAGLLLYFFETVYQHWIWMIVAYVLLILFILACWFILRPAASKRKTNRLNETINKLENISNQFLNN